MGKVITKSIFSLFIILSFIQYANAADSTERINVTVDVSPSLVSSMSLVNDSHKMVCKGRDIGYQFTKSSSYLNGLDIFFKGPYDGDSRNTCTLESTISNKVSSQGVYFSVESLPISFKYKGVDHTCYINQQIGLTKGDTNRDPLYPDYISGQLAGQYPDTTLPCNGLVKTDTYYINTRSPSNKDGIGSIHIKVQEPEHVMIPVKFNVQNHKLLTDHYLGEGHVMGCAGKSTESHPAGYKVTKGYTTDSSLLFGIEVSGPFNGDQRESCTLVDATTKDKNKVYFAVTGLPIYYTYKGVQHSCMINQHIGTSYNSVGDKRPDKLQGQTSAVQLSCNGAVAGDTYILTPGHKSTFSNKYDPGNITINVAGS